MANNLGITEVTLAQASEATHAVNLYENRPHQNGVGGPLVIRITDHADNVGAEEDDPDKMAIFVSKAFGKPWVKDYGLQHIVVQADADPVANPTPTNVTVLYPNYDYTQF